MRVRVLAGLGCAVLIFAAGCGGGSTAGEPSTVPKRPSSSQAGSGLPKYGAPAVTHPLDVSSIAQDPCKAVTKQQMEAFPGSLDRTRVSPTTATGEGKSCGWIFDSGGRYGTFGRISGGVVPPTPSYQGLTSIYEGRQDGSADTFRPVDSISGYPGVVYASGRDIGEGYCRLTVGLRNDTAYRITTGLDPDHPSYAKPCDAAKKLAGFVVQTLKEAQ